MFSEVRPFISLPAEEHRKFHSDASGENHPHSLTHHPIFERVHDPTSKVVSIITFTTAWDDSMLNLLPENVNGIICVVKNTCGQVFTYEVHGKDAFYLGDKDFHDPKYNYLEVKVDLSLHTHPDFASQPGHCLYSMVSSNTSVIGKFCDLHLTSMPS